MDRLSATMPPASIREYWSYRWPWMREEDIANLLDGLRKAGWQD
jgi:hypothetical protein